MVRPGSCRAAGVVGGFGEFGSGASSPDPGSRDQDTAPVGDGTADDDQELLAEYVQAFEAYDIDRLVRLLATDAAFSMPPYELWLRGADSIESWWRGPGQICRNSRTIPTSANRQPAVAVYHDLGNGHWEPFALHVLDLRDGRIGSITHFMGPRAFEEFGLPPEVTESGI